MLKVSIDSRNKMRYNTLGDFFVNGAGTQVIEVFEMGNKKYEQLIALHEFVESVLCEHKGITVEQVDAFDGNFKGDGEPGDRLDAPYHQEHRFATMIEHVMCIEMGLDWDEYNEFCNNLTISHGELIKEKVA